jgi:hypothetical protein
MIRWMPPPFQADCEAVPERDPSDIKRISSLSCRSAREQRRFAAISKRPVEGLLSRHGFQRGELSGHGPEKYETCACGSDGEAACQFASNRDPIFASNQPIAIAREFTAMMQLQRLCCERVDGLFALPRPAGRDDLSRKKIDRSMSIVSEAEQIADRRNSPWKSRARISDGSRRRCLVPRREYLRRQIKALPWLRTIEWE